MSASVPSSSLSSMHDEDFAAVFAKRSVNMMALNSDAAVYILSQFLSKK